MRRGVWGNPIDWVAGRVLAPARAAESKRGQGRGWSLEYRREIDGLRAIAVLPVIMFHSGAAFLSGGFVGVDVFFVLSGYLITSILLHDLAGGKYSIARFYERRIRRIIPALFVVILATIPLAWLWMTPTQFTEMGNSIISIVAFVSNMFFWSQSDYFAGSAELKPFLHTWSLAVEEQYYLLFPPVLALVWRWRPKLVLPLLVFGMIASLALSEWASVHAESANFYLAPTRAWELLAGAICAFLPAGPGAANPNRARLAGVIAFAGLAMILYAIFFFNDQMRFPGLSALLPVGGTALVVLYGTKETLVARFLSVRALVGVGLISYSAYLWHQPLFALARLRSETEPPGGLMALLAVASLGLAALSWRFVEQPFRVPAQSFASTRARVFAASGVAAAALIAMGAAFSQSVPPTYMALANPAVLTQSDKLAYEPQVASADCPGFAKSIMATCRRLGNGPRRIVIWGDSHANALSAAARPLPGFSIYILGHWGCPPLVGVARYDGFGNFFNCDTIGMTDRMASYVEQLHPQTVFLVARWTLYANGRHFQSRLQRDTYFLTDGRPNLDGARGSTAVMIAGIGRTVDMLRSPGAKVFVVQQVPDLHDYSPRGLLLLRTVPRAPIERWHASEGRILSQGGRHGAGIVSTHDLFCRGDRCALKGGNKPLYIDDSHVSYYGAERVFARLIGLIGAQSL